MLGLNKKIALALIGAGVMCLADGAAKADTITVNNDSAVINLPLSEASGTWTYAVNADYAAQLDAGNGFTIYDIYGLQSASLSMTVLNGPDVGDVLTFSTVISLLGSGVSGTTGGVPFPASDTNTGPLTPNKVDNAYTNYIGKPDSPALENLSLVYTGNDGSIAPLPFNPLLPQQPSLAFGILTVNTLVANGAVGGAYGSADDGQGGQTNQGPLTLPTSLPLPSTLFAGGLLMAGIALVRMVPKVQIHSTTGAV